MNHSFILTLFDVGAIQFGKFKKQSGTLAPFDLDLRVLVSHPDALREAARALVQPLNTLKFDRLAAIPYAALPIGTAVAMEMNRPLIYPRQAKSDYGTERVIEGKFIPNETVVLIDDVIRTGKSKLDAIGVLGQARLKVRDVVVLIDHEQGGAEELAARKYNFLAVYKITEVLQLLKNAGKISAGQLAESEDFVANQK